MLPREHFSKSLHSVFFKHIQDLDLFKESELETERFVFVCQNCVINTLAYRKQAAIVT